MLLEIAVGDAYGAGFEYADAAFVASLNDLSRYVKHPRHAIVPGCYTDDAQMSLAIAEAILSGESWTREMLAQKFVGAFKRDPREGYAGRFYDFLVNVRDGEQFLRDIRPDSDKSGAAMRAVPLGVCVSVEEVLQKCTLQAAITHNTPDGINAAVAVSLAAHYFLYDVGEKRDLGLWLERHVAGDWTSQWRGKVKSKGWMSVRAALTALREDDSLSAILQRCISFGGDVDTVAAIALGIASCSREVVNDLPENLVVTLENNRFGRDYIVTLDQRLLALVAR
jgi:ADP-ribosyl-[dinitrogen reductase] hydrolase